MIRIHKDTTTADAIADNIKLVLGDVFENDKDLPKHVLFRDLIRNNNNFKEWLVDKMKISSFVANRVDAMSSEPFMESDYKEVVLEDEFIDKVFSYINDMKVEDFINYRLDLISESQKEKPNIVEVG